MQVNRIRRLALSGLAGAALVSVLGGCVTTGLTQPVVNFSRQVSYGDSKAVEVVTNEFGSTDLQMIAEKMVTSLLEDPIFNSRPTLKLGNVKNKTSEYIDTKNIMSSIRTQVVKSHKAKIVSSNDENQAVTDELSQQNQTGLYKKKQVAKIGNMAAAKYLLAGELTSIVKQNSSTKDVFYKFTLNLYTSRRMP
jgi:uncharacterized protein (TIGR02722 family)